jgi:hypothetical protein
MLCHATTKEEVDHAVIDAVIRNFGFCDISLIEININAYLGKKVSQDAMLNPKDLIVKNLTHGNFGDSRQQMIVEDRYHRALEMIVEECERRGQPYEIIFDNQASNHEEIRELFKDLLLKIEHGIFFIVVGFEELVPFFFSALEKQRENILKKNFMQLPIGTHFTKFSIHHTFKCVFIVNEEQYARIPASISGIFEIHRLTNQQTKRSTSLPTPVIEASKLIQDWFKTFKLTDQEIN